MTTIFAISSPIRFRWRMRRGLELVLLALVTCVLLASSVQHLRYQRAVADDRQETARRLASYVQLLEANLVRYEALPDLLALERDLARLLDSPSDRARVKAANTYLEATQQAAGVNVVYLIDRQGLTLAASNWRQPDGFVGQNYAYRPYFRDALAGRHGYFFGIGVTTGEPGYFLSAPIKRDGRVIGVVVVKVSLDGFERALVDSGEMSLLADRDGIVFIASRPAWCYRSLSVLSPMVRQQLAETRQYGESAPTEMFVGQGIGAFNLVASTAPDKTSKLANSSLVHLADKPMRALFWQARDVGSIGWRLLILRDPSSLYRESWVAGAAAGFALAFVFAVLAMWRLRQRRREELQRLHTELESRIAQRTADLSRQVAALERTEGILRKTRDTAVQAGKLAVLGQMAAGLTHELSQPLAALHTYSDNASTLLMRGQTAMVSENLAAISHLAGRLGRLVAQLKSFARNVPATPSVVAVDAALATALLIVEPRRRELAAMIDCSEVAKCLFVRAEAVRFEQVLVNLLRNALDASATVVKPRVVVIVAQHGDEIQVVIRDNGSGISPETASRLFEPFFTTKPAGDGLGLGLVISQTIVESFGGRIEAGNASTSGAEFSVWLGATTAEGNMSCPI